VSRRRGRYDHVMGIDPSLNGTGVCLANGETSHLELNSNKTNVVFGMSRVVRVVAYIELQMSRFARTHVCMEGYALHAPGRTHDKAELHSIIKLLALSRGIPIILVGPTTLKLWTTGHGHADKEQMIETVSTEWGVSVANDDEADAYALMKFGEAWLDRSISYPQEYRTEDALDKADYLLSTNELQTLAINFD